MVGRSSAAIGVVLGLGMLSLACVHALKGTHCAHVPGPELSSTAAEAAVAAGAAGELAAGTQPVETTNLSPTGTAGMVQRLRRLADELDITELDSARRLTALRSLTPPEGVPERLSFDLDFATELLKAGQTNEAVERLQELLGRVQADPGRRDRELSQRVRRQLAIALMRLGEQENCVAHHGIDSCLLPIRGSGVHAQQRGSRGAIREYTTILRAEPLDLMSRWLLNVAYMTVGEYPDRVPPEWLIPPQLFESEYDIKRFYDVAARAGVDIVGRAGGVIMDDFDQDGHLDLMVSSWGNADQLRLLRNRGDGSFEDVTEKAGLGGLVGGLQLVQADYDNDGALDVIVLRGAWLAESGRLPNSLLHNDGHGSFADVTEEAGLLSFHPTQTAAWGDYDNDGWVDLFIGNESLVDGPPHPCELYRNDGDGTFSEVAADAGVAAVAFFKGAVWGDYDNDGRLDLYLAELSSDQPNRLYHNDGPDARGRWSFSDVTARAGVGEPQRSFPTWFFDYDNDGWLDLFVSGYAESPRQVVADYLGISHDAERPRLYRNLGNGSFEDVTRGVHLDRPLLAMGSNFGDLDGDGWLDFYVGTGDPDFGTLIPNVMFRNAEGGFFQDVTTSGGFGHLQKGHGVAFGDVDGDGDQDVFLKVGGAFEGDVFQSALFENPGHGNHWITLKLVGVRSNRAAIGARLRVTVEEPSGTRDIHVTVTSGSSFGGSSLQQEIGLGRASRIRAISIRWPAGGQLQVLRDVEMDRFLEVREEPAAG